MSTQTDQAEAQAKGRVKWFNLAKGYGFIEPEDGGPDIMMHAEIVKQSRYFPQPGDGVRCGFKATETGRKATWLIRV